MVDGSDRGRLRVTRTVESGAADKGGRRHVTLGHFLMSVSQSSLETEPIEMERVCVCSYIT